VSAKLIGLVEQLRVEEVQMPRERLGLEDIEYAGNKVSNITNELGFRGEIGGRLLIFFDHSCRLHLNLIVLRSVVQAIQSTRCKHNFTSSLF
jgi:hypothetical protein